MKTTLLASLASLVVAAVVVPASARAADTETPKPRAENAFELSTAIGGAGSTSLGGIALVDVDFGVRFDVLRVGGTAWLGGSNQGMMTAVAGTVGPVFDLGPDVAFLGMVGRHSYTNVGGVGPDQFTLDGCGSFHGADGAMPFVGARVDVHPRFRPGAQFLWGVSAYYARDLSTSHVSKDGTVQCSHFFADSTTEPRHVDATVGGNEIGLSFRIGFAGGF